VKARSKSETDFRRTYEIRRGPRVPTAPGTGVFHDVQQTRILRNPAAGHQPV